MFEYLRKFPRSHTNNIRLQFYLIGLEMTITFVGKLQVDF